MVAATVVVEEKVVAVAVVVVKVEEEVVVVSFLDCVSVFSVVDERADTLEPSVHPLTCTTSPANTSTASTVT